MSKSILAVLIMLPFFAYAQAPQAFNYQATARDTIGNVLSNQVIGIKFSILSDSITGAVQYSEAHSVTTNHLGYFVLAVGRGNPLSGSMSTIDWGNNSYFLQVELDPAGGSNYSHMGTQQLLSVPYALYAQKAGSATFGSAASFDLDYPDGIDSIQPVHLQFSTDGQNYTVPVGMNFHGIVACTYSVVLCSPCPGFILNNADTLGNIISQGLSGSLSENTSVTFLQGNPTSYLTIQGYVAPKKVQSVYHNIYNSSYTVPAGRKFFLEYVYGSCAEILMGGNIGVKVTGSILDRDRTILGIFDEGTVLSSPGCYAILQGFLK